MRYRVGIEGQPELVFEIEADDIGEAWDKATIAVDQKFSDGLTLDFTLEPIYEDLDVILRYTKT